jgi:hypothetical protein
LILSSTASGANRRLSSDRYSATASKSARLGGGYPNHPSLDVPEGTSRAHASILRVWPPASSGCSAFLVGSSRPLRFRCRTGRSATASEGAAVPTDEGLAQRLGGGESAPPGDLAQRQVRGW